MYVDIFMVYYILYNILYIITLSSTQVGKLADSAAVKKRENYQEIATCHHIFLPIALETTGAFGQVALDFIGDLAKRIHWISHDPLS